MTENIMEIDVLKKMFKEFGESDYCSWLENSILKGRDFLWKLAYNVVHEKLKRKLDSKYPFYLRTFEEGLTKEIMAVIFGLEEETRNNIRSYLCELQDDICDNICKIELTDSLFCGSVAPLDIEFCREKGIKIENFTGE